ncbi:MAG: hypothetical protein ACI92S_001168, partial [Planctomycetaceae bacterium]
RIISPSQGNVAFLWWWLWRRRRVLCSLPPSLSLEVSTTSNSFGLVGRHRMSQTNETNEFANP